MEMSPSVARLTRSLGARVKWSSMLSLCPSQSGRKNRVPFGAVEVMVTPCAEAEMYRTTNSAPTSHRGIKPLLVIVNGADIAFEGSTGSLTVTDNRGKSIRRAATAPITVDDASMPARTRLCRGARSRLAAFLSVSDFLWGSRRVLVFTLALCSSLLKPRRFRRMIVSKVLADEH
jgi:hypothetical protein